MQTIKYNAQINDNDVSQTNDRDHKGALPDTRCTKVSKRILSLIPRQSYTQFYSKINTHDTGLLEHVAAIQSTNDRNKN